MKKDLDKSVKERDEASSKISKLEFQLDQLQKSSNLMNSELNKSKSRCISLEESLSDSKNTIASKLTDKACLQIDLSEKQVRLDLLRAENADLILKSSIALKEFEKEKQDIEAKVLQLQTDLEQSQIEQAKLSRRVQELDITVLEINLEGFSNLFDCLEQNLENDFVHKHDPVEKHLPVQHFRAFSQHEKLVSSVMESIDRHYRNRGFGKYCRYLENNFPDTCCIL